VRSHFATTLNAVNGGEDKNGLRDALAIVALIGGTGLGAFFIVIPTAIGKHGRWSRRGF
jgi:hypothetical protein